MTLHPPTLLIANMTVNAIAAIAFALIWREAKQRYRGLQFLFINLLCQVVGMLLIVVNFNNTIGQVFGFIIANTLLSGSLVFLLVGILHYRKLDSRSGWFTAGLWLLYAIVAGFSISRGYGKILPEAVQAFCIIILEVHILYAIWSDSPTGPLIGRGFLTIGVIGYIVVSAIRMLYFLEITLNVVKHIPAWIDGLTIVGYTSLAIWTVVGLILMVTQRLVIDIEREEKAYRVAYEAAPYALLISESTTGHIKLVNHAFELMFGITKKLALDSTMKNIGLWDSNVGDSITRQKVENGEAIERCEVILQHSDGRKLVGLLSVDKVMFPEGKMVLTTIADVTELANARQTLKEQATHDMLTGLPNRYLLQERLDRAIARSKRHQNFSALIVMDLDKFKPVNDLYGHEAGDIVLVTVSQRLRNCLRECDTPARLGGDEFVIVAEDIPEVAAVEAVANKIVEAIREPIIYKNLTINISASLGIALCPLHGDDQTNLFRIADEALYQTKSRGRDGWSIAELLNVVL